LALDRLSNEDVQILNLERGAIRGHTCKVLVLERAGNRALPTLEALRDHLQARLHVAPRLGQRVVPTPLGIANPSWCDDPDFDIARHVTRLEATAPIGAEALREIVARRMSHRLDRAHPLWHIDLVAGLPGDARALIWRVHHAVADGTTCMRLGSEVLWDEDPSDSCSPASAWTPGPTPTSFALVRQGVRDRVHAPSRPRRPGTSVVRGPSPGVLDRELGARASITPFAHRIGPARTIGFAGVSLSHCRAAVKSIDQAITVNDVVLGLVAGGVRAWLQEGGNPLRGIRAKIPVSLHQPGEGDGVGNRDSYFFVDLPVDEPDPLKRLLSINRETQQRKLHHDAEMLYRLGHHPFVARWAMSPHVFTFNVSNVRGPAREIYVLGARVREMYSVAEIAQHHALRVAALSVADALFFGLCADRAAVSHLDKLTDGLRRSADELLGLAR
jgi:WS/DGAT/MGAT family acyltransferase